MKTRSLSLALVAGLLVAAGCGTSDRPAKTTAVSPTPAQATPAPTPLDRADESEGPARRDPWTAGIQDGLKPTLLVANFATDSDDKPAWGSLFSQIAALKLGSTPTELFSLTWSAHVDQEYRHLHRLSGRATHAEAYSPDDGVRLARMFGVERVVTGRMEKRGEGLRVAVELRDAKTSAVLSRFDLEGTTATVPAMLAECCARVAAGFGVSLDTTASACLARPQPATGELFAKAAAVWSEELTSPVVTAAKWRELHETDPEFTFAKTEAVRLLLDLRPREALAEARRLHAADPRQTALWLQYLGALYGAEQYPEMAEECTRFLAQSPRNVAAMQLLALAHSFCGRHEEALALSGQLAVLEPNNWRSYYLRAVVLSRQVWENLGKNAWTPGFAEKRGTFTNLTTLCAAECRKALKLDPWQAETLGLLSICNTNLGQPLSVIERLCREAIDYEPDNWTAHWSLVRVLTTPFVRPPDLPAAQEKAMAICRKAAEQNPRSAAMQWLMCEYLWLHLKIDEDRNVAMRPPYFSNPVYTKAIEESMRKALALDPEARARRARAAYYYFRKGDFPTAWEHYAQLTDYIPERCRAPAEEHEWWKELAVAAAAVGRWDEATSFSRKGLERTPCPRCREALLVALAGALEARKDYDEALTALQQLAETGLSFRGWAAREFAQVALEQKPELQEEGYRHAQQAVELAPRDAASHLLLARYHLKRGERQEALAQLDAVLQLNPANAEAQRLRAEILATR